MSNTPQKFEYFAFISYKREDEKWAKWLQKKLESYSLPTAIRKDRPELPNKIRPVFRDQSELSGGNLKAEIEKGLNGSKYLIVICSPRSAKSPWVSKEVQHFIDHGREEYIIPFIVGGTPNASKPEDECFPEGLRQLTVEKEVLGININEMGRDAAAIKVISRMFVLRFDSLWQRYKRTRRRKTFSLIFIAATLLISAAIITLIIANQNNQLSQLNKILQEENKTFSHQKMNSERYLFMGSLRGNDSKEFLIQVAYHPYDPIIVFSDDWGYWIHYIQSNVEIGLSTHDDSDCVMNAELLGFTRDGSEIIASSWGGIFVWDATSLQLQQYPLDFDLLERITKNQFDYSDEQDTYLSLDSLNTLLKGSTIFSINNNIITALRQNTTAVTSLTQNVQESINILYNKYYNEVLFVGDKRAALYDINQNKFIQFFKGYDAQAFSFSPSGEYLRIGKDIFARNFEPDTIADLKFEIQSKPIVLSEHPISNGSNRILKVDDNSIEYNYGNSRRKIEVIRTSSMGNGQEYLLDAIFVEPNKIIAIVEQGKHRIYNAYTGNLLGAVDSYIWDGNPSMSHEQILSHAESNVAFYKIIDRDLYVVSSGAVIRIYDIDRIRLKKVIELPFREYPDNRLRSIDHCDISENGDSIIYKFHDNDDVYLAKLPK